MSHYSEQTDARVIARSMKGLSMCLPLSATLTSLEIFNVRLTGKNLNNLCQGLMKTRSLDQLSMRKCRVGDTGVQLLCQSIKNVPSLTGLSLIDCHLAEKGALAVASLLQHQRINRDSAMWQDTLRLRQPHLDGMRGLRRVTLNHNPQISDEGTAAILDVLAEDLWIKALDLQHCGLSDRSGKLVKKMLEMNQTLEVVDLRRNPFIPDELLNEVMNVFQERQEEGGTQYAWLEPEDKQSMGNYSNDNKSAAISREHLGSTRYLAKNNGHSNKSVCTSPNKKPSVPAQFGVPWRVEHRLYERREGLAPGTLRVETQDQECSQVQTEESSHLQTQECSQLPNEEQSRSEDKDESVRKMRKLLSWYKKRYHKEKELRKRLQRKLTRLQAQVKKGFLLDETTVSHIETCFLKFHTFLAHLQITGFRGESGISQQVPGGNIADHKPSGHHSIASTSQLQDSQYRKLAEQVRELYQYINVSQAIILENDKATDQQSYSGIEELGPDMKDFVEKDENNDVPSHSVTDHLPNDVEAKMSVSLVSNKAVPGVRLLQELQNDIKDVRNIMFPHPGIVGIKNELDDTDVSLLKGDSGHSDIISKDGGSSKEIYVDESSEPLEIALAKGDIEREDKSFEMGETGSLNVKLGVENGDDLNRNGKKLGANQRVVNQPILTEENGEREINAVIVKESHFGTDIVEKETGTHGKIGEKNKDKDKDMTNEESQSENHNDVPLMPVPKPENAESPQKLGLDNIHRISDIAELPCASESIDPCSNEMSETDDEKLRMKTAFIRLSGRNASLSSSGSITEQLSQSHSLWSGSKKFSGRKIDTNKADKLTGTSDKAMNDKHIEAIGEYVEYASDFEVSDIEGLSISASSLASTSIPDDLVTPGEEEF